jgi:methylmalonyl-CoA/ethylmalonyl-CoA epimerase
VLPLLTRIDHVGIACRDLAKTIELYRDTFGLRVITVESNEEQGVREAMLAVGPGAAGPGLPGPGGGYVQLLEPLAPDTPVGKFLARRGEGIHHIGYGVTDITQAMSAISEAGIRLIDERPRHGSMGASIAFLHPADLGGVLTELVQFVTVTAPPQNGREGDLTGCVGWRTAKGPPPNARESSLPVTGRESYPHG